MTSQTLSPVSFRWNRIDDSQFQTRYCAVCQTPVTYAILESVGSMLVAGQYVLAHTWCVGTPRTEAQAEAQAEARARVEEALTGEPAMVYVEWCHDCASPWCRR